MSDRILTPAEAEATYHGRPGRVVVRKTGHKRYLWRWEMSRVWHGPHTRTYDCMTSASAAARMSMARASARRPAVGRRRGDAVSRLASIARWVMRHLVLAAIIAGEVAEAFDDAAKRAGKVAR